MKRSTLILFLASCLLALAITWGGVLANGAMPRLMSGERLSIHAAKAGARMGAWEESDGKKSFQFTIEEPAASYSLYIPYAAYGISILINDMLITPNSILDQRLYTLPSGRADYTVTIRSSNDYAIFIGCTETMAGAVKLNSTLRTVSTSVTVCLALCTLMQFLFKREESYIGYVCLYMLIMAAWLPIAARRASIHIPFFNGTISFWLLMSIVILKVCVSITRIPLPPRLQRLLSWPALLLTGALLYLPCYFNLWVECGVFFMLSLLSLLALSKAVTEGVPASRILLLGKAVTTGFHTFVLMGFIQPFSAAQSLPATLLINCRIFDFPFMFACIFFINRKFARNFSESISHSQALDALVQKRTRALLEQQSARQSMMLNIFHDLRTPLFVMKNCIGLLKKDLAQATALIPIMEERNDFVCNLTEDLFLAAKLEEKQVMLDCQAVDMHGLLTELCRTFSSAAVGKELRLAVSLEEGLRVWGDPMRLRQIFQNLLANACYYSPVQGEIRVLMVREGDTLRINVGDCGKGIPSEELPHIFDRYFHTTAANKHESTGLGLTIAHDLAALHKGSIQVESQLGRGSQFIVRLPLID